MGPTITGGILLTTRAGQVLSISIYAYDIIIHRFLSWTNFSGRFYGDYLFVADGANEKTLTDLGKEKMTNEA